MSGSRNALAAAASARGNGSQAAAARRHEAASRIAEHEAARVRILKKAKDTISPSRKNLIVPLLEDGETVHNAFFDRDFTP